MNALFITHQRGAYRMDRQTIDTAMVRRMVKADAIQGATIIGQAGGWSVMLRLGHAEKLLGTQRTNKLRTWRSLDTCMDYLRNELHILRVELDATHFSEGGPSGRSRQDAAERMKRAHEAAAYDAWFRAQVQASIDDPRANVSDDEARAHFAARKAALRQRIA